MNKQEIFVEQLSGFFYGAALVLGIFSFFILLAGLMILICFETGPADAWVIWSGLACAFTSSLLTWTSSKLTNE
jgi:hypothetical protein